MYLFYLVILTTSSQPLAERPRYSQMPNDLSKDTAYKYQSQDLEPFSVWHQMRWLSLYPRVTGFGQRGPVWKGSSRALDSALEIWKLKRQEEVQTLEAPLPSVVPASQDMELAETSSLVGMTLRSLVGMHLRSCMARSLGSWDLYSWINIPRASWQLATIVACPSLLSGPEIPIIV